MEKHNDLISQSSSLKEEEFISSEESTLESTEGSNNNSKVTPSNNLIEEHTNKTNLSKQYFLDTEIIIDIEHFNSAENRINKRREDFLHKNVTPLFLELLKEEDFEFGYKTKSEKVLWEQLLINELAARNWLNELFVKHFHDEKILIGILRILGRFDEQLIFPQGQTMALAALNHRSDEIKELGIRAFEKWTSFDSLNILKKLKVETKWLSEYVTQVTIDLEEQLCLS